MIKWISSLKPLQLLLYGYLLILIIGFLLLCIPYFHLASIDILDQLFIATSALSTTGLATIDISTSYNFGGQFIILILIQIGGLGYMSIGSFLVLMKRKRLSLKNSELIKYDFSLPDDFSIHKFIRHLIVATLLIEFLGAIFLAIIFWQEGESNVIWKGIFHSISAFCTAGFSLYSNSFEGFRDNFFLNLVISALSISGALGFIVFTDLFERLSGKKEKTTLTSKIIIRFTFVGVLLGTVILFLSDTTIAQMAPEKRLMTAFFQSMTAFTTVGFNTHSIGDIAAGPLFFLLLLMVVGASPSGTGGGMKSTTITALYAQLKSTFRGGKDVIFMNKKIPSHRVRMAMSNFFFYVLVLCIGTYFLLLLEQQDPFAVIFEAVSALGTVGISTGVTSNLSTLGKWIIITMMFLGRIGPLSFGMILFTPEEPRGNQEEDIAI